MVQTWTPSERKATTAAAMAKIGDSAARVTAAGGLAAARPGLDAEVETPGADRPGVGALRFTVACGTDLGAAGRVILAVSFLGSEAEGADAGTIGLTGMADGVGGGTGAVVDAALNTGEGAGDTATDGGLGAEGIPRDGKGLANEGAGGTEGGFGADGAAPGIGRGFKAEAGETAGAAGADTAMGGFGMEGAGMADGGFASEGAAEGFRDGAEGMAEGGLAVGMAEGGFGMPAATGLGIPGTEAGFIPGGGGGTTAARGWTGFGGRLIIAASPEPGATGAPSRRLGRTMRTVSFFGSDI